jgi:uncharacterized protein DUF1059
MTWKRIVSESRPAWQMRMISFRACFADHSLATVSPFYAKENGRKYHISGIDARSAAVQILGSEALRRIFMSRRTFDCRPLPGDCTLAISGSDEEVIEAQAAHAVAAHAVQDTPQLREWIRSSLKDAAD